MTDFVFLGSAGRSGTHILRAILDSHPEVAAGPEFDPFQSILHLYIELKEKVNAGRISAYMTIEDVRAAMCSMIETCVGSYAKKKGSRLVVEKTPSNVWVFPELYELFPSAKFIHLVRDGRDVVCSHLEVGKRFSKQGMSTSAAGHLPLTHIYYSAGLWAKTIAAGFQTCGPNASLMKSGNGITLHYADLVRHPEETIRKLCEFLAIDFDPRMLEPEKHSHDVVSDEV